MNTFLVHNSTLASIYINFSVAVGTIGAVVVSLCLAWCANQKQKKSEEKEAERILRYKAEEAYIEIIKFFELLLDIQSFYKLYEEAPYRASPQEQNMHLKKLIKLFYISSELNAKLNANFSSLTPFSKVVGFLTDTDQGIIKLSKETDNLQKQHNQNSITQGKLVEIRTMWSKKYNNIFEKLNEIIKETNNTKNVLSHFMKDKNLLAAYFYCN